MSRRITVRWNKKESDWWISYPDNAGKSMSGIFFDMLKTTGHRTDWEKNLQDLLTERGYDFRTLKITVDKAQTETPGAGKGAA